MGHTINQSYIDSALERGWNEVLIKYARDASAPPFAAHVTLSTMGRLPWPGRRRMDLPALEAEPTDQWAISVARRGRSEPDDRRTALPPWPRLWPAVPADAAYAGYA
jgi:hypothetical protein